MTDTTDDFDKRFDELLKPKVLEPADADQLVLDICKDLPPIAVRGGHLTYQRDDRAPQVLFDIAPEEAVEIEQAAPRAGRADRIVADDLDPTQVSPGQREMLQRWFSPDAQAQREEDRKAWAAMERVSPPAEMTVSAAPKITIQVYLTNGVVREYEVDDIATAREHLFEIVMTGYRSVDEKKPHVLVHWPPHKIVKVKAVASIDNPIQTNYFDRARGT